MTIDSPVANLLQNLAAAPFLVAPERREDLKQVVDSLHINIVFDGRSARREVSVDPRDGEITFGVGFAERLWAYCCAYTLLVEILDEEMLPGRRIDFSKFPEWETASQLLRWAHSGQVNGVIVNWPSDLPRPESERPPWGLWAWLGQWLISRSWLWDRSGRSKLSRALRCCGKKLVNSRRHRNFVATEAFLCMGGWILLHECGHVVKRHHEQRLRVKADFERIEYEADDWASAWMLERWATYSTDDRVFVKRRLA
jgi:hypothetical protein